MDDTDFVDETVSVASETAATDKPKRKSAVKKTVKKAVKAVAKKAKKAVAKKAGPKAKKAVAKAKKAKKAVKKAKAKGKGNGGGSKKGESRPRNGAIGKVVSMLKSSKGTTRDAVLKAINWKAISMQQIADGAGLKLKINKEQRPYRYSAA